MTKSTPEVRPEPASRKSAASAQRSRHRAEPAAKASPLSRFAASLQGSGRRAAVVTTACAVLIGVGAAGQASEPVAPATSATGAGTTAATADAEPKLAFEKILVSAMPAPASVSVTAQSSEEKPAEKAPEAPAPAAAPEPAPAPAPPVAVDDPAAAQAYAASQLGTYGWAADQMQCLTTLWTKESDWKTTATNASSGAYGIVQSLPAEKMASAGSDYLTNFRTQINWGLNYVKERYGSPCGALNFHYANNWY
ncbi:hypothetical protein ACFVWT_20825 [Arthrobacter sp. NPDC058288]|uniref:aggregation-promoting factor C-terminal-like domain-containing protein n=1 Tax=Arthrobacter sp. NPDC058288 TaxID=3346424 RepID=UPI0036EDE1C0